MKQGNLMAGIALLSLVMQGCGSHDDAAAASVDAQADAVAGEATQAASPTEARLFDREAVKGDGCPLLSAGDVAGAAGLAADDISTSPVMDCVYEWDGGLVVVSNIRVHRTTDHGREHYARATRNMTAQEVRESVEALGKDLDAKAAAGEITRDQAAIAGVLAGAIGDQEVTNTALDGIGDQASHDGTRIKVLVGNVMFDIYGRDDQRDFDLEMSRVLAQRVVRNLEGL